MEVSTLQDLLRDPTKKHIVDTRESVAPHQLAYDRPSPKLFPFLRKHFKLDSYVPQSNRFVVYDAYFSA
ncbi:hypothetical protein DYB37_003923 [Aphanomyces astaci]|uniref:N-acetyltransferase domain-containing protein n=1 Tax=Aphanomyces astaci TaxID=112090 RepID=A0A3R7AUR5_APHAT|nr:hypothetical protein DYB35_005971 [Aphanomyces astaci]RHZ08614.1 hypothetical protein DYB37_003923 [Aphanomyces astaci]